MNFFADEVITVTTVKTLTKATIDGNAGTSKATYARIENRGSDPVIFRFISDPVVATSLGHLLAANSVLEVSGYDNLVNIKFLLFSGSSAKLFVSYAA